MTSAASSLTRLSEEQCLTMICCQAMMRADASERLNGRSVCHVHSGFLVGGGAGSTCFWLLCTCSAPRLATSHLKSSDVPNHLSSFNSDFVLSLWLQTRQKVEQECFPSSLCYNLHTTQTPEDRGVKDACQTACPRNCFVSVS